AEISGVCVVGGQVSALVLAASLADEARAVGQRRRLALERAEVVVEAVVLLDDDHDVLDRPTRGIGCGGARATARRDQDDRHRSREASNGHLRAVGDDEVLKCETRLASWPPPVVYLSHRKTGFCKER